MIQQVLIGNGIEDAAIDHDAAIDAYRHEQRRNGGGCRQRLDNLAAFHHHFGLGVIIRRDHLQGNGKL
ncbi:hypothetical protein D3C80_1160290 [compost metagenome]